MGSIPRTVEQNLCRQIAAPHWLIGRAEVDAGREKIGATGRSRLFAAHVSVQMRIAPTPARRPGGTTPCGPRPAKLDAGRHITARWLRRLADDLDALSLDDAAEVLAWLQDRLAQLRRGAERILSARRRLGRNPCRPGPASCS